MARYIPAADHIFLSEEAQALSEEAREVHADTAEHVLGLSGYESDVGSPEEATALSAVARQISAQVAMAPDFSVVESWSRGGRSETYRDLDALVAVDPLAKQMADSLLLAATRPLVDDQSRYTSVRSLRGRDDFSQAYRPGEEHLQP